MKTCYEDLLSAFVFPAGTEGDSCVGSMDVKLTIHPTWADMSAKNYSNASSTTGFCWSGYLKLTCRSNVTDLQKERRTFSPVCVI